MRDWSSDVCSSDLYFSFNTSLLISFDENDLLALKLGFSLSKVYLIILLSDLLDFANDVLKFIPVDLVRIESGALPSLTRISEPGKYFGVFVALFINRFTGMLIPHDLGNSLCTCTFLFREKFYPDWLVPRRCCST